MIGVVRRNPSREMFIRDNQLILKDRANGNIDQRFSQNNDWITGGAGDNKLLTWGKYQGGDRQDPNNYVIDSEINRDDFPDV